MPSDPGTPTLDQLQIFLMVVDVGSFTGAARKLGRATSVVSYAIANLEAQLGVSLFDRESTRKPQLTEDGRAVLSVARGVANSVSGLRATVKGMRQGLSQPDACPRGRPRAQSPQLAQQDERRHISSLSNRPK